MLSFSQLFVLCVYYACVSLLSNVALRWNLPNCSFGLCLCKFFALDKLATGCHVFIIKNCIDSCIFNVSSSIFMLHCVTMQFALTIVERGMGNFVDISTLVRNNVQVQETRGPKHLFMDLIFYSRLDHNLKMGFSNWSRMSIFLSWDQQDLAGKCY